MTDNMTTNTNEKPVYKERLKFYADTPQERNKYFCWEIVSIIALKERLWSFFDKGWNIKAAWYEKINQDTGEIENTRINLQKELDEYFDDKLKNRKR